MRWMTAGIAVAALVVYAGMASSAGPPDPNMDQDGDGVISILDLTILAQHFTEVVGPANPCVNVYRGTPDAQGYTVKIGAEAGHPIFAGDVRLVPCVVP